MFQVCDALEEALLTVAVSVLLEARLEESKVTRVLLVPRLMLFKVQEILQVASLGVIEKVFTVEPALATVGLELVGDLEEIEH